MKYMEALGVPGGSLLRRLKTNILICMASPGRSAANYTGVPVIIAETLVRVA